MRRLKRSVHLPHAACSYAGRASAHKLEVQASGSVKAPEARRAKRPIHLLALRARMRHAPAHISSKRKRVGPLRTRNEVPDPSPLRSPPAFYTRTRVKTPDPLHTSHDRMETRRLDCLGKIELGPSQFQEHSNRNTSGEFVMTLSSTIKQIERSVESHEEGDLTLGWRICLWEEMKATFGEEADFRRNVLAYLVLEEMLQDYGEETYWPDPDWPKNPELIRRLIREGIAQFRLYLCGQARAYQVVKIAAQLDDDDLTGSITGKYEFLCYGVCSLQWRVPGDDDLDYEECDFVDTAWRNRRPLEITEDSLEDTQERGEVHRWAADMASYIDQERFYLPSPENIRLRRDFWLRWLKTTLPKVLGPIEEVKALVETQGEGD